MRLDTSMLDGGATPPPERKPDPRPTPLVLKVVDRVFHKRERCDRHCHCVTAMGVKVGLMFYLFLACLAYFIPREIYGWMRAREVPSAATVTSTAERTTVDRAPPRHDGGP